jgi:hypothetical protein
MVDNGVGALVGFAVCRTVGREGMGVRLLVAVFVGLAVCLVGFGDGRGVGDFVTVFVGLGVGILVGFVVGRWDGPRVGLGVSGIDDVFRTKDSASLHAAPFGGIASTVTEEISS